MKPDWRTPADYPAPQDTGLRRWAWEFLRRNQEYRADWAQLASALRAAAESQPELAPAVHCWLDARDDADALASSDLLSRWILDDAQLEHRVIDGVPTSFPFGGWFARKWGLGAMQSPQSATPPDWSHRTIALPGPADVDPWAGPQKGRKRSAGTVALSFDLARPLAPQIESATNYLRKETERWQNSNPQPARGRAGKSDAARFVELLRVLDADAETARDADRCGALAGRGQQLPKRSPAEALGAGTRRRAQVPRRPVPRAARRPGVPRNPDD